MPRLYDIVGSVSSVLVKDKGIFKHVFFAGLLMLLTTLVVVAYYLNHPRPEVLADTASYLYIVRRIQTQGQLVNSWRLPGYPLLIVLAYALTGRNNLAAVSAVQAVLFVLATLELYVLAILVLQRAWMAFLIGLLVGVNLSLLSYVKPIMSEAMALWLVVSLALAAVYFLHTLRVRALWLVTACLLLLFLTRPEWMYLPIPLYAYLLLVAAVRGKVGRLLAHTVLAVVLLYAVLGGYTAINAKQNHFAGVTSIENINMLGKVLQYNMQDEASPQYADVSRILDSYVARGIRDPYPILAHERLLGANDATLAGEFAQSIIVHHPGEFLLKSLPLVFSSLTVFHSESPVDSSGPYSRDLLWLQSVFHALYKWNMFFPLCALLWILALCWRRTRSLRIVQAMGVIVLLSLYGLITTTLGAYRGYDYMRIHILFDPLLILVIWGSFLLGALLVVQRVLWCLCR